jgi:bla regulator protein BlaR1
MEALNRELLHFFDKLLWISIQSSVVIILILLIQKILRGRLGIRWHYLLWFLLLIRLAIPWLPDSRISIFNFVPRSIQQGRLIESFTQTRSTDGMGFYIRSQSAITRETTDESGTASVSFTLALPALWLIGTALIAGYVCVRNINLWLTVKRERPITDQEILDLLEDCKMEMGVQTIIGVVVSDKIKSPALFGFVRPRLLLPQGLLETCGLEELRYVFIHELAHLKQRDIYFGWLMALLQIAHWFNPLMWFAFRRMRADRELACDGLAISMMDADEPPRYSQTIVNLLENFSQVSYVPSVAGILEDKSQIERRIKMIAGYKKPSRTRWAGAMLLLAILACVVLTNAYVAKADFTLGTPTNLGPIVNSSVWEGQPSISADGLELYFVSDRSGGSGKFDLWVTTRETKDDEWGPPMNLGPTVNTSAVDRCPSISADGLSLFFESNRKGGAGSDDVWVTTRATKDDPWGAPVNLGPMVNRSSSEGCPSISADGLSLFFRAGGRHRDIWVTTWATSDDDWDPPVNLGPTVNSAFWDSSPSISHDSLLLFLDSDRPGGYGGSDLYVTMRVTTSDPWSPPVNLGPTVNSSFADGAASISDDGSTLFFMSRRPDGLGDHDLWQVPIKPIIDLNSDGIVDSADICIIIDHWNTDEPLCDIAPMPWGDGIVDIQDLVLLAEHLTIQTEEPNESDVP